MSENIGSLGLGPTWEALSRSHLRTSPHLGRRDSTLDTGLKWGSAKGAAEEGLGRPSISLERGLVEQHETG